MCVWLFWWPTGSCLMLLLLPPGQVPHWYQGMLLFVWSLNISIWIGLKGFTVCSYHGNHLYAAWSQVRSSCSPTFGGVYFQISDDKPNMPPCVCVCVDTTRTDAQTKCSWPDHQLRAVHMCWTHMGWLTHLPPVLFNPWSLLAGWLSVCLSAGVTLSLPLSPAPSLVRCVLSAVVMMN